MIVLIVRVRIVKTLGATQISLQASMRLKVYLIKFLKLLMLIFHSLTAVLEAVEGCSQQRKEHQDTLIHHFVASLQVNTLEGTGTAR